MFMLLFDRLRLRKAPFDIRTGEAEDAFSYIVCVFRVIQSFFFCSLLCGFHSLSPSGFTKNKGTNLSLKLISCRQGETLSFVSVSKPCLFIPLWSVN